MKKRIVIVSSRATKACRRLLEELKTVNVFNNSEAILDETLSGFREGIETKIEVADISTREKLTDIIHRRSDDFNIIRIAMPGWKEDANYAGVLEVINELSDTFNLDLEEFDYTKINLEEVAPKSMDDLDGGYSVIPVDLNVQLIAHTPDPTRVAATGGRMCYSNGGVQETVDEMKDPIEANRLIEILKGSGHMSPLEHVYFTFGIEGVSRALSHQLVRHRLFSYSQKSQRYVAEMEQLNFVPPIDKRGDTTYMDKIQTIFDWYKEAIENGEKPEDARSILPNCTETKLVMSGNARTIIEFLEKRLCSRAQTEIRKLAEEILYLCKDISPAIFKKIGPPCIKGPCPEGKLSCGEPVTE